MLRNFQANMVIISFVRIQRQDVLNAIQLQVNLFRKIIFLGVC